MRKVIVLGCLLGIGIGAGAATVKSLYKVTRLTVTEFIVTCQNGGDPTFKHLTPTSVLMSCGTVGPDKQ